MPPRSALSSRSTWLPDSACTSIDGWRSRHGISNRNFAVRSPLKLAAAMLLLGCGMLRAIIPAEPALTPPRAAGAPTAVKKSRRRLPSCVSIRISVRNATRTHAALGGQQVAAAGRYAPRWLVGLFYYLSRAGSLVIWMAGAIVAAIAIVWSFRFLRARSPDTKTCPTPTGIPRRRVGYQTRFPA
jgi:hypothetical protein